VRIPSFFTPPKAAYAPQVELISNQTNDYELAQLLGPLRFSHSRQNPMGFPAKDCCSATSDYAKLFRQFLAEGGEILKKESINEIMTSQLVDPNYFLGVINGPVRAHLGQTWPEGAQVMFGLSSSIKLEDFPWQEE